MALASGIGKPASLSESKEPRVVWLTSAVGCRPEGGRSPLYEAAWEAAQPARNGGSGVYPPVQRTVSVRPSDRVWLALPVMLLLIRCPLL